VSHISDNIPKGPEQHSLDVEDQQVTVQTQHVDEEDEAQSVQAVV